MKNLKVTILSACIALCCLTNGNAQETARGKSKGKVVMTGRPGSIVVFGGGTSMPSSDGKDKAFLSNTASINADVFLQLKRWTPVLPKPHTSIGLNIGAAYNFGGSVGFGTTPNPFAVTGQTSSMVSDRCQCTVQAEFRMGVGPQANFYFGKFIVSPMVLGEYFSMTQKEMSIVQTTQFNGQSYDFNLATLPETKTSGFAVTPKLRLHYMFNDRFGLFADASYTMGPKIETTVSKLIPNGNPSPQSGSYNIQQLQTGTMVKGETKSTAYSAMGFNFGVVIGLGRNGSKGWNGVAKTAHDDGKGQQTHKTADTDDIRKGWNGLADAPEELEPTTPSNVRIINNCCDATVTGSILWDPTGTGAASSFVPATPSISISMSNVTLAGGVYFNSAINCLTYSGCIDPTPIKYKVNGALVGTSAIGSYLIPITAFSGPGSYTIKVIGTCGGSKCKAKTLQLIIF